ncbi:MAG TPA: IclR family transcriptional regulator [Rhizobiaceae bacterium]|nr:IclR family transcriptional regulator [Rhizobiaceae bacterium]
MQSHERMLGILNLFDADDSYVALSFEEIHARLGYTRSTLYRYLKALSDAGLLSSLPGLGYVLGPRIIELDYKIRSGDPLIRAAQPIMEELARQFSGIALLCRKYRDQVLCVHQESGTDQLRSNYERGRTRPLLKGAASVAILAHLPHYQLGRLYSQRADEFRNAGYGTTLAEVKTALKAHRQRGWVYTQGDVTPGAGGIAAPLFDGEQDVLGSLSLTLRDSQISPERLQHIADHVVLCARIASKAVARS